ncbi:MAG: membrane fusion protein (multidrug efflux system) [Planctomycetota bacterium]|jgi:membrane fusion protein (multidrug efflux system)
MKIRAFPGHYFFVLAIPFCALAAGKAIPVSVVTVAIAPVYDEIPLTGSVTARRLSRISPKTEGFVSQLLVDEGDKIKQGDALLRLDPVMAKIGLARVQAQVQEAQAILGEAERQRDEAAELVKKKHISATNHEALIAEVGIKAAILDRLQAELSQQEEILSRHTVYAPFDGVIISKEVEVGQWVETSTSLVDLVEISVLRIDVPVPQIYFGRIIQGTPATIKFDAYPERSFEGNVSIKIPAGNTSTRTFPVRIEIENESGLLAPGMSVRVRFILQQEEEAMLLPRDAIVRKPDGSETIWLLYDASGQTLARSIPVKTGRAYRNNVEVFAADLKVGDKVVIRGNEILQANQSVYIVGELQLDL